MRLTWTGLLLAALISVEALPIRAAHQDLETAHVSWWIQTYGVVDVSKDPRAARAEEVFDRLAAAADKRAKQLPKMAILDADGSPFAMALPDGTVLLTRGALRICYQKVSESVGDARLAFVIGHELSHLGNDDFWHSGAFLATDIEGSRELMDHIVKKWFKGSPDEAAGRELKADAYGALYMTIAGYDPRVLLEKESFFKEWASELDALGIRTAKTHPKPGERAVFLETQLESIANELDFFHFGTRLVQLGRYQDGLLLLERFRESFPSREVLNNIGVAHYQLAARFLGECDGRLVTRFMLPTRLDINTRAVRLRGHQRSSCFDADRFRTHHREAQRNLEGASRMDQAYIAARMNLLSLHILAQEGAQAFVAAMNVKKLRAEDPEVLSGEAVALYLMGEQSGIETADAAIEQLQRISRDRTDFAQAAYNFATLLSERRRVRAAEEAFRAFLQQTNTGVFAEAALNYLGTSLPEPVRAPPAAYSTLVPALPLGPFEIPARFAETWTPEVTDFVVGDFTGSFVRYGNARALVIDNVVELIEEPVPEHEQYPGLDLTAGLASGHTGEYIIRYPGLGLLVQDGSVVSSLHFSDPQRK